MSFKSPGSKIFMIGKRKNELGGSLYYSLHKELGANVPNPNIDEVKDQIYAIPIVLIETLSMHVMIFLMEELQFHYQK